ncbi:ion transporter [Xanthomonas maliensis]|uniref:ion transporter n=1 Tax=Xanthomonas maliensis TaxID=1321368 RepID=UPI0003A86EBA|nr:ion transporter [Xanthomonas maliensis]KAB7770717.1 ion transporter [Xanthomonas maliensis]
MRPLSDPPLTPATEGGWRRHWFDVIYRHDTRPSRNFDLLLVVAILASVVVVMLDSVPRLHAHSASWLVPLEWAFTALFTLEYLLRLAVVRRPLHYTLSIWGVIDLLSILPSYLSFFVPGAQTLLVVRVLRLLRLFRILKLTRYVQESGQLLDALWRSRRKVLVFLFTVLTITVIAGASMYVIEGPQHGFTSIPTSMYWAIVTMATVGFGDLVPQTTLGRFVTSALILIGYSIIAVPTGIYTAELASSLRRDASTPTPGTDLQRDCGRCGLPDHQADARYCRRCAAPLIG